MRNIWFVVTVVLGSIIIGGCEDPALTRNPSAQLGTTILHGNDEGPGSYTDHPNGSRYAYPEIIFKEFIPKDDLYNWKTLAWRITWPVYAPGADADKIPTLFSLNGALNSFYYLNNVDPANTYKTVFSLYHDNKLTRPADLATELDFVATAPKGSMKEAWFVYDKWNTPLDHIQHMVEQAPGGFQWNYYDEMTGEIAYNAGDYFKFRLDQPGEPTRWGGIRIVSMTPRIIEVYVAVPQ
ncbi:hypothetical protein [Chryseolinea sp. H1M3-3]|uniref:hypothetical protein n=1 Tax=Chryseolinea sp. H1M3-3 TaxID=3034144 RepID=UPI0023EC9722|nr:hypothetical protein [Chryseolinea sp. H1M3-3]